MQLKIKSVRVIKEGERKDGTPYKWLSVIADDGSEKGTEYTTFDQKPLSLGPGSIIDIGEPKTKEGKLSFIKILNIINETPPVQSSSTKSRNGEYDQDRIDSRAAFQGIVDIACHGDISFVAPDKLAIAYNLAIDWAIGKLRGEKSKLEIVQPTMDSSHIKIVPADKPPGLKRVAGIDMDWLQESLGTLHERDPDKWRNASVIEMVDKITGKTAKSVSDAVSYLNPKQANDFVRDIQKELDAGGE